MGNHMDYKDFWINGKTQGRFLRKQYLGDCGLTGTFLTSSDGITWTSKTPLDLF